MAAPGDWVEIRRRILDAGERAPRVPADTAAVPLDMLVRGFLVEERGGHAVIETLAGRRLEGEVVDESPSWDHSFGAPLRDSASSRCCRRRGSWP